MNTKKGRSAMLEKVSALIRVQIREENDRSDEEGFTLIELLIVVIVLGILAAVTVFGLSGSASSSARSACRSDARTTEVAVDAYHTSSPNGTWPVALTDLTTPAATNAATPPVATGWVVGGNPPIPAPFLRTTPGNPPHYTISLATNPTDGTTHVQVLPAGAPTPLDFDITNGGACDGVK